MSELIEFNLNHYIHVRLTDIGKAELKRQHDELAGYYPNIAPYLPPKEDEEGFSKFRGWMLIGKLGHLMNIGNKQPFDINIKLENKQ